MPNTGRWDTTPHMPRWGTARRWSVLGLAWAALASAACGDENENVSPTTSEGTLNPDPSGGELGGDCAEATTQSLCVPADGEVLLYGAVPDPDVLNMQLFFSRPSRLGATQLTPDGESNPTDFNSYGARSPDRQTVAFVSGRDKPPSSGSISRGVIYLAAASGGSERRLTATSAQDCNESMPRYSPDGAWLSFWRSCTTDPVAESIEFMFRIHPDGTAEERLVDPARSGGDSALSWGTFSRDGATLYALQDATPGEASSPLNILVAYDFESRTVTPIIDFSTDGGFSPSHPLELANGDLLYEFRADGGDVPIARLETIRPDGTGRTSLRAIPFTENAAVQDFRFMINPAGDRLAYVHVESPTTTSLWTSAIDGGEALQVAPIAGTQFWLTWNQ